MKITDIKKRLKSIAEQLLQLAEKAPDPLVRSRDASLAAYILTDAVEKLGEIRSMYMETLKLQEDPSSSAGVHRTEQDRDEENPVKNEIKRNDNGRENDRDINQTIETNRHMVFPSSLDISLDELQMLEEQIKEEALKENDGCLFINSSSVTTGPDLSFAIESDEELELEMLNALEDIEDDGLMLSSQPISENTSSDFGLNCLVDDEDDDEDEGIEEADEDDWDPSVPEPKAAHITCLKTYFGHSNFKPVQWKVISSVLQERKDNLVVMATGYGKSLCYQFAPVYCGGVGIVISPLISLMEDQVLQLEMSNIPACFLGSAQTQNVLSGVRGGRYRVVYMTPEFCSGDTSLLQHLNNTIGITLIAIDEAHCISQWGHDFRAAYRSLGCLKTRFPSVPIVALTATASPSIRVDIAKSLKLVNPQETCTSFDRPNLYLEVGRKTSNIFNDLQPLLVKKKGIAYEFDGPTIVYCPSRRLSELVTAELLKLRISCGTYHAGKGVKARRDVHHRFVRDEIQCVVATIAFGMGINKPDIRKVIHYGAPKEMESYYQEIGRAGRDGLPSSCHVFWAPTDMNFNRHMLSEIKSGKFREYKMKMLAKMEKYLNSMSCRRKIILSHFEDKQLRKATSGIMGTEKCCDNCRSRLQNNLPMDNVEEDLKEFGGQAYLLLSAISALGGRFGIGVPVLFLKGSNSQRLPDKYRCNSFFGSGKNQSENWWKALARQLIADGFLKEGSGTNKFAVTCGLTAKGHDWISRASNESHRSLLLQPTEELCPRNVRIPMKLQVQSSISRSVSPSTNVERKSLKDTYSYQMPNRLYQHTNVQSPKQDNAALSKPSEPAMSPRELELQTSAYGKLVEARQKIASEKDIPPAVLATNKILVEMAKIRPTTIENLKKIDGVSDAKSSMLAPLLNVIQEFCLLNNLQTDVFCGDCSKVQEKRILKNAVKCSNLSESANVTYSLFQDQHLSLSKIAETRMLSLSVVGTHLSEALKSGYSVDLQRAGLSPEVHKVITNVIQNPPVNSDISQEKKIRDLVPTNIEIYLIRMVIAMFKNGSSGQIVDGQAILNKKSIPELVEVVPPTCQPPQPSNLKNISKDVVWIETVKSAKRIEPASQLILNSKQEVPTTVSPPSIKLTSWNQSGFDADTDELFADSHSQSSSCQTSKRKLPNWFGENKTSASVPSPASGKKAKTGKKRGLFD